MNGMTVVSHVSDKGELEPLEEHLQRTADLCRTFADSFSAGEYGYMAGFLHDVGKYSKGFQNRILHGGPKVEHASCGALVASESVGGKTEKGKMMAFVISGHHTGLPDGGSEADTSDLSTLRAKLNRQSKRTDPNHEIMEDLKNLGISLKPKVNPSLKYDGATALFSASFFVRMLFSCLVDADFLATEEFMAKGKGAAERNPGEALPVLLEKLNKYMKVFGPAHSEMDKKRLEILKSCCDMGSKGPQGLYSLTVPTGGGKTLSSLMFALTHGVKHHLNRVIYVIPYTTIIDQTVKIFSEALGSKNVLAHYSQAEFDDYGEDQEKDEKKLASENWDAPVVVTTNVQFFESLFASRTSRCRKLHNIAKSVVVFDEAQMIPLDYLRPCLWAIGELTRNYAVTSVLCTATQPSLNDFFPMKMGENITEIWQDSSDCPEVFRRYVLGDAGDITMDDLVEKLNKEDTFLCIVNSRKKASDLYKLLLEKNEDQGELYHLSTLMTPLDRRAAIEEIKRRLKDHCPCRVVSTSLVEAGVDLDFPTVFREWAGLDSIIQAAGRCNREGKRPWKSSFVWSFDLGDLANVPNYVKLPKSIGKKVSRKFQDYGSPSAIKSYFEELHVLMGEKALDYKGILDDLKNNGFDFPFRTVAKKFRLIEEETKDVLVLLDEAAKDMANSLREGKISREIWRKLGSYRVPVYASQLKTLEDRGQVEPLSDGKTYLLLDPSSYDKKTGLLIEDKGAMGIFI